MPSSLRRDEDRGARAEVLRPPRHEIAILCMLALRDFAARTFLLAQSWREVLSQTPDAEMLTRILEAEIDPEDAASLNAFMTQLTAAEEALVAAWLVAKLPPNGLAVAEGWWSGLRQAALRRQLQIAEGRMRIPRLSAGEEVVLQKQIVDLRKQLDELSALSSARVLET
jgi:hypothetical protein